ncbi:MAG: NUDIX domain-containing protein [Planctomycetaceae bacterium]
MQSADELFDVCDADDQVVGQATRGDIHAQSMLHRAVHIWVQNSAGELILHLRSTTKDQYPSCYTSSASGHLDAGESYLEAAHRELREELSLSGNLEFLTKLPASPETAFEHTVLYRLVTDAVPTPCPQEIAGIEYLSIKAISHRLREQPKLFTPPFRKLWQWFETIIDC